MSSLSNSNSHFSESEKKAYSKALLRTLSFANVKFVRYLALDVTNNLRCKAVPVSYLQKRECISDHHVPTATVVWAGLEVHCDHGVEASGLSPQDQLVLVPDLDSLRILPYSSSSAVVLGSLFDQKTGMPSDLCCRSLLRKIVQQAGTDHKIGFNVGAELEFCLYNAKTDQPVDLSNYAFTVTLNQQDGFIEDVYEQLKVQDIEIELLHSESSPGQLELVLSYLDDAVQMADSVVLARETISNVARKHGMKALFLPKFNATAAGNGAHIHLSMYDLESGENLFVNKESLSRRRQSFLTGSAKDISPMGQSFMEGVLQHLPGLLALTLPTSNSFRRVGPGCWTGSQETWAFEDKESPLRVVAALNSQAWEHVEVKVCDATANMYLALAGLLSAGLDGMAQKLELRADRFGAEQEPALLPKTVQQSLDCLENDKFLNAQIPPALMNGYLALRRSAAVRTSKMSLEDEVKEALERA